MFSSELMEQISNDLNCLNKQISLIRTFEFLYNQSLSFHIYQSRVQYNNSLQYVYDYKPNEQEDHDLNKFANEFNLYTDLRVCECPDFVLTVYMKLVEYHTNLYDMADDKRDNIRIKEFDRIMYYRIEICQLLLRCLCFERLLVEIENGRKFLEKFQNDTNDHEDVNYQYHSFIVKYTYDYYQAVVLQHSRAINDSKQICEQSLKELNQAYQDRMWEKLISDTTVEDSAREKRHLYERSKDNQSKDSYLDSIHTSPSNTTIVSNNLILFIILYMKLF